MTSLGEGRQDAVPRSADGVLTNAGLESSLRLLYGQLRPAHTPDGVSVTGNITLADLRKVFPGF